MVDQRPDQLMEITNPDGNTIDMIFDPSDSTLKMVTPINKTKSWLNAFPSGSFVTSGPSNEAMAASLVEEDEQIGSTKMLFVPDAQGVMFGAIQITNGGFNIAATTLDNRTFFPIASELETGGSARPNWIKFLSQSTTASPSDTSETFTGTSIQFKIINANTGIAERYTLNAAAAATNCNFIIRLNSHTGPEIFDFQRASGGTGFDLAVGTNAIDLPGVGIFFRAGVELYVTILPGAGNISLRGQTLTISGTNETVPFIETFGRLSNDINVLTEDSDEFNALTEKTDVVDADVIIIEDSEDSYSKKKITVTNLRADTTDGDDGWSPVFAVVSDNERRVLQVSSWTGGTGTPPASGVYLGSTGFVTDIAQAIDIRGAAGAAGSGAVTDIVPRTGNVVFANADNGSFNVFNILAPTNITLPDSAGIDDDFLIHVFNWSPTANLTLVGTSNQTITVYENNSSATGTARVLSNRTAYIIEKRVPPVGLNRWTATPLSVAPTEITARTDEEIRDVIGTALRDDGATTVTVDDAGDTITVESPVFDRIQSIDIVTDAAYADIGTYNIYNGTNAGTVILPDATELDGRAWAAKYTTNNIDLTFSAPAGFTLDGGTASDFILAGATFIVSIAAGATNYVSQKLENRTDEEIRDVIGTALVAGANITITVDDPNDTITIAGAAATTPRTDEEIRDVIGTALVGGTNITVTVDDPGDTITIAETAATTPRTDEEIQDVVGGMVSGNTETGIAVTYQDTDNNLDFSVYGKITDYVVATSANIPITFISEYNDLVGTHNLLLTATNSGNISGLSLSMNGQPIALSGTISTDGFNQLSFTLSQQEVNNLRTNNAIPRFDLSYTPFTGAVSRTVRYYIDLRGFVFVFPTATHVQNASINLGVPANFAATINRIIQLTGNATVTHTMPLWSATTLWDTSANDVFGFSNMSTQAGATVTINAAGMDYFENQDGTTQTSIVLNRGDRGIALFRDPTTTGRFFSREMPADAPGTGPTPSTETPVYSYAPVAFPAGVPFLVDGSFNQLFFVNDPTELSDEQNIHGFVPSGGIDASDGVTPTEFTPIRNGTIGSVDFGLETYTAGSPVYLSKAVASAHYLTANPSEPNIIAICGVITDHVAGTIYNIYVSVDLFQWSYAQRNYEGTDDTTIGTQGWSSNQINQLHRTFVLSSDQSLTDDLFASHRDFYVVSGGHTMTLDSVTYPNYQWFCHVLASGQDVPLAGTGTIIGPSTIPDGHTALILMDPIGSSYYVTLMSQRPNLFTPDAAGRSANVRRSLLSGDGAGTTTDELSDFIGLTILPSDRRRVDLFFTEVASETLRNLVLRRFFNVATDAEVEAIATETIRLSSAEFFNSYALVDYTPTNLNQTYFFVGYGYFTSPTPRLLYNGADTTTGKLNAVYQANTTHELVIRELNGGWHIISCDRDISGGWTDGSEADATAPTSIHSLGANEQSLTVTSGPDEGTVHYYPPESDVGITFTGTLGSITYPPVHTQLFNSKRGALYAFSRLDDATNGVYTASMRFLFTGTHTADDVNILRSDLDATLARTIDASGNTVPGKIETDEIMTARATFQELLLHNLPTTQPTEMGVVWNDSGTLKIS